MLYKVALPFKSVFLYSTHIRLWHNSSLECQPSPPPKPKESDIQTGIIHAVYLKFTRIPMAEKLRVRGVSGINYTMKQIQGKK